MEDLRMADAVAETRTDERNASSWRAVAIFLLLTICLTGVFWALIMARRPRLRLAHLPLARLQRCGLGFHKQRHLPWTLFVGAENTTHGQFKDPFLSSQHHRHLIHHTAIH